jgi:hypothetical protein
MRREALTKQITLTLTPADKALLLELADAKRLSMRAFMRLLLRQATGEQRNRHIKLLRKKGDHHARRQG